ncbi:4-carboxymuconolactone decarboxylase [Corynebacterium sp. S7]
MNELYEQGRKAAAEVGEKNRRAVLGDAHVDRANENKSEVTEKFQDFITRTAWGDVWNREGLDHTQRRLITIAIMCALGNYGELDMHIRAALRAGVDSDLIGEVMLHTAVYAGVPNSNHGFKLLDAAVKELNSN